jgi:hypothetical protein
MKKLLLIAVVAIGFLVAGAPKSEARVFFNIGIGLPFGFYPYPAYYSCGYPYYPYAYAPYYAPYYGATIYYSSYGPYYWHHGRRIYLRRHY